jgi:hypothetical protein
MKFALSVSKATIVKLDKFFEGAQFGHLFLFFFLTLNKAQLYWKAREWILKGGKLIKNDAWNEALTIKYKIH